jgi:DNA-binding response OmpR family regulator
MLEAGLLQPREAFQPVGVDRSAWRYIVCEKGEQSLSAEVEANLLLKKNRIDFALLDYMLPDGNGVELGAETRQRLGTTVVMTTGTILPPDEEQLCEQYDMPVLRKPFLFKDLLNIVAGRARGPTIFIGHGRSQVWQDLRYFLSTRLNLNCEEFNNE